MRFDPSTTLHDLRWGKHYQDDGIDAYVWVFEISGAAPASYFVGGYAGVSSERQPPMYFLLGGGTLKGGKPAWRDRLEPDGMFVQEGVLHVDLGRGTVVELPEAET